MGTTYIYANHDRRQFFDCGLYGWNSKHNAIGRGPGARALALLLSESGSWKGERISVIGDAFEGFLDVFVNYLDIEVEAELLLIQVDGLAWLSELDNSTSAFCRLCEFALYLHREDIHRLLDEKYGVRRWEHEYRKHLSGSTHYSPQKVIDASQRQLKIWG